MTKVPRSLRNDFRETARRIIADDRAARRYGRPQNTVGVITNALEHAYRQGDDHALSPPADRVESAPAIRWEDIPAASRNILFCIAPLLERWSPLAHRGMSLFVKIPSSTSTPRWALRSETAEPRAPRYSKKGIGPLLKLNILVSPDEHQDDLAITEVGLATLRAFQLRWDQNDPRLPILSLRG
jgi:hypothetical protein